VTLYPISGTAHEALNHETGQWKINSMILKIKGGIILNKIVKVTMTDGSVVYVSFFCK